MQKSKNWALPAIVAALYVAISLLFAPLSFNAVQIRFAELFNHLAAFNKKYIIAVTLGCFITNLFSTVGMPDLIFGTAGTIIGTCLTWYFGSKTSIKWQKYAIATVCQIPGTFLVALEMHLFMKLPLVWTWVTVSAGEMLSMIIGAIIIDIISRKIDFSKGEVIRHAVH
ncbi:QueT transporter family protein [Bombilactobacillus bombi]|uniref:QueT transporter family protein n=1 Tax=Bombilactobacillus bombi TaxID=1303590 RepID=UPI000E58E668|nr:QueT transporter family protein [Bombilactobacillus bombi]AXX64831.1 QueT transporter family protein [Bombilactobacillus bombi]